MFVTFNGKTHLVRGAAPKKRVRWFGTFLVADAQGHGLQAEWKPTSNPPMNYREAREAADRLIDTLKEQLHAEHALPIHKVAFHLSSR